MSFEINPDKSIDALEHFKPGDRLYAKKEGGKYSLVIAEKGLLGKIHMLFSSKDRVEEIKEKIVLNAFNGAPVDDRTEERIKKVFDLIHKQALPQLDLGKEGQALALASSNIENTDRWIKEGAMLRPRINYKEWGEVAGQKTVESGKKYLLHENRQEKIDQERKILKQERSGIEQSIVKNMVQGFRDKITDGLGGWDNLDDRLGHRTHGDSQRKLYGLCEGILLIKKKEIDLNQDGKKLGLEDKETLNKLENDLIDLMETMKKSSSWNFISRRDSKKLYKSLLQPFEQNLRATTYEHSRIGEIINRDLELSKESLSHTVLRQMHQKRADELSLPQYQQNSAGFILFSKIQEELWETVGADSPAKQSWESLMAPERLMRKRDEQLQNACLQFCRAANSNQRNESKWDILDIVKHAGGDREGALQMLDDFDTRFPTEPAPNPPAREMRFFKELQNGMREAGQEKRAEVDEEKKQRYEVLQSLCMSYLNTEDQEFKEFFKSEILKKTNTSEWKEVFASENKDEIPQKMTQLLARDLEAITQEEIYQKSVEDRQELLAGLCKEYCESPQEERGGIQESIRQVVGMDGEWLSDLFEIADNVYPAKEPLEPEE